jgi:methylaspartate ammonia-lyase
MQKKCQTAEKFRDFVDVASCNACQTKQRDAGIVEPFGYNGAA